MERIKRQFNLLNVAITIEETTCHQNHSLLEDYTDCLPALSDEGCPITKRLKIWLKINVDKIPNDEKYENIVNGAAADRQTRSQAPFSRCLSFQ